MARLFVSFVHEDEKVASAVQGLLQTELNLGEEVFLSSDKSLNLCGGSLAGENKGGLVSSRNRHSHAEPTFCGPSVGQLRSRGRVAGG